MVHHLRRRRPCYRTISIRSRVLTWDFETPDGQVNLTELEANLQPGFD
jgi:hypothetical protein